MIVRLSELDPARIETLVSASRREGFEFLIRLCADWASAKNRFERPGEALFGVFDGDELIGIGGINRQDDSTGRLRRFYILPHRRRQGWGGCLLRHILSHAAAHFRRVILRTDTETADRFYCACGFARIENSIDPTHRIELQSTGQRPNQYP